MKREKFLWPLTQGHHRGLVAARNIKNRLTPKEGRPSENDLNRLWEEVKEFWGGELEGHFAAEEELMKVFAAHAGTQDESISRVLKEHQELKECVMQGGREKLIKFCELLPQHIRYEENVFFGKIEKALTQVENLIAREIIQKATASACIKIPRFEA